LGALYKIYDCLYTERHRERNQTAKKRIYKNAVNLVSMAMEQLRKLLYGVSVFYVFLHLNCLLK
ncbi:MAG: hypothetical protein RIA63_09730, partial [Cyclobacteriaceae bacterium]